MNEKNNKIIEDYSRNCIQTLMNKKRKTKREQNT